MKPAKRPELPKNRTVEVPDAKLAVFPTPKTASSSLKSMIFKQLNGIDFNKQPKEARKGGIHGAFFPTKSFNSIDFDRYKDYTRITVVRDPISRFLSAYDHRVRQLGELNEDVIDMDLARKLDVPANPGLKVFVRNLDKYRLLSHAVCHHTDPFTRFLGPDLGYYTDVFRFDQLNDAVALIGEKMGAKLEMPHKLKQKKEKSSFESLPPLLQGALLMYCAGDYALMKGYYSDQKYRDMMLKG